MLRPTIAVGACLFAMCVQLKQALGVGKV